jgi:hypothetical protein
MKTLLFTLLLAFTTASYAAPRYYEHYGYGYGPMFYSQPTLFGIIPVGPAELTTGYYTVSPQGYQYYPRATRVYYYGPREIRYYYYD